MKMNATSKKYDKVLFTPHKWLSSLTSSRDLSFHCVADIRWNNSHEVIARSYCDETLPKPMERTIVEGVLPDLTAYRSFLLPLCFTICSLYIHYIFTICLLYVHYMFTIYSGLTWFSAYHSFLLPFVSTHLPNLSTVILFIVSHLNFWSEDRGGAHCRSKGPKGVPSTYFDDG